MFSTICFLLSAICWTALFLRGKPEKVTPVRYTYDVQNEAPRPTWQRKLKSDARPKARIG